MVGQPGGLAAGGVADGNQPGSAAPRRGHGGNGVGRLPGLAHGDHQRPVVQERFPVAELGRRFRFGRHARQRFDQMPPHLRRVQAGAAPDERHPADSPQLGIGQGQVGQRYPAGGEINPVPQGGHHRLGLLHYLLEHKMAVAAPVHQHILKGNRTQGLVQRPAGAVQKINALPGNYGHLAVLQKAHGQRPAAALTLANQG